MFQVHVKGAALVEPTQILVFFLVIRLNRKAIFRMLSVFQVAEQRIKAASHRFAGDASFSGRRINRRGVLIVKFGIVPRRFNRLIGPRDANATARR